MHLRRPSTGVSTEDSDDEGGTGGTGGANPCSSNEYSLITVNHKKGHDGGGQRTKTKFTAHALFHCKIRKLHYVFKYITHQYESLNVNKVNSK